MNETQIERFGKYILLEKLASGGMAEVFLGKSHGANGVYKYIAIKRILPQYSDNEEFIEMFKDEAKIAVHLSHSNVVSIYEFGIEKKQLFLVMDYVEGRNLRQILNFMKKQNLTFSIDQIVYMIKEIAAGLDHAHRCIDGATGKPLNITHRDMSPQNIMISFEGEVKVVDFGIAKAGTQLENTKAGTLKGKFGYMSPEQAEGQVVDHRTDVFSLGIVLWELLANDRLFVSNTDINTLRKIRDCQVPSLRKINPQISPELERICNKALAKDKTQRYQTAAAFHRDLNKFLNTNFPEFSPHDLGVFMKTLFSEDILKLRQKMIEYGKIILEPTSKGEKSEVTETLTSTSGHTTKTVNTATLVTATEQEPPLSFDTQSESSVNLEGLSTGTKTGFKIQPTLTETQTRSMITKTGVPSQKTQIKHSQSPQFESSRSWGRTLLFLIALSALGYAGYTEFWPLNLQTKPANPPVAKTDNPPPVPGKIDLATTASFIVHVDSSPSGAKIYLDGKDTGFNTPGRISVKGGSPFALSLVKEGFLRYDVKSKVDTHSKLNATLQPIKTGYVTIAINNGGNNPVIYVNGLRLSEKPPIDKYPIPAGVPIKIRAENPFAETSAELTVTVQPDERKDIRLLLRARDRTPSHE